MRDERGRPVRQWPLIECDRRFAQDRRAAEQSEAENVVRQDLAQYKVEVVSVMICNIVLREKWRWMEVATLSRLEIRIRKMARDAVSKMLPWHSHGSAEKGAPRFLG